MCVCERESTMSSDPRKTAIVWNASYTGLKYILHLDWLDLAGCCIVYQL